MVAVDISDFSEFEERVSSEEIDPENIELSDEFINSILVDEMNVYSDLTVDMNTPQLQLPSQNCEYGIHIF